MSAAEGRMTARGRWLHGPMADGWAGCWLRGPLAEWAVGWLGLGPLVELAGSELKVVGRAALDGCLAGWLIC